VTSQQAVVTVTVVASGLVTVPETFNVTAGQTLLVNVLASDTDSTGTINPATLSIVGDGGGSQGGTAVVQSGEISYTPAAGFTGTDTLSYQVKDSNNVTSAPTLLTFIVTSGAAGPIANPDSGQHHQRAKRSDQRPGQRHLREWPESGDRYGCVSPEPRYCPGGSDHRHYHLHCRDWFYRNRFVHLYGR